MSPLLPLMRAQSALKETIRKSGVPVYEDYKFEHLAELLEKDLWKF